jgi:uncharacterized protein DUF4261
VAYGRASLSVTVSPPIAMEIKMLGPSVYISLDEPISLDQTRVADALVAQHPGTPIGMPDLDSSGGKSAMVLSLAGFLVAVMQFDVPLPDGWQMAARRAAIHWPDAETTFRRHRAHYRVSVMGESENRLQASQVITALVGAIVATHRSCSGVLWDLTVANSSQVASEFSRSAFAPYPDFPTGLWVGTHPFRDRGAPRIGVVTSGLRSFIGREVELEAPASQLKSALTTVRALVAYLLQQDRRLLDGDTIGATADERIPVRLRDSRHFKGLPVIAASLGGT